MAITLISCKEDHEYEMYMTFFITHRHLMTPPYPVPYVVQLMAVHVLKGHVIIAVDDGGDVVAAMAYFYGTPEREFQDTDSVFVEILLMKESYRRTMTFFRGFQHFIDEVEASGKPIARLQLYANAESGYLRRLYSKFARASAQHEGFSGPQDIYEMPFHQVADFIRKLDSKTAAPKESPP